MSAALAVASVSTTAIATTIATTATRAAGAATPAPLATRTSDGIISGMGIAAYHGSPGAHAPAPLVGVAGLRDGSGYWVARANGGIYRYGSAASYGSVSPSALSAPLVGIAAHPSGKGYWAVSANGRVFAFGTAAHFGAPASVLSPVIGIAPTPTGKGYWLGLADGGVMAFGDAPFKGSAFGIAGFGGGATAIAATMSGYGYWVATRNGAILNYGSAAKLGAPFPSTTPITAMASTRSGAGYVVLDASGRLRAYGDAANATRLIPRPTSVTGGAGQYRPNIVASADAKARVASVSVALDRRAVAVGGAGGFHSFWVLSDPLASTATMATMGSTGAVVRSLQQHLLSRGYWLQSTGTYDAQTRQAVWAFQKALGRPRTGVVSAGDYRALIASARIRPRSTTGYVAEIDKARQIVTLARNGVTLWVFNTSTGTERPYTYQGVTSIAHTPTGQFKILREINGLRVGRLGSLWRPKYFTGDGVAFHGSASIPPYPASHGCARLSNAAIDFIWDTNALPIGTTVLVY